MIELPRRSGMIGAMLAIGCFFAFIGLLFLEDPTKPAAASAFFLVLAGVIVLPSVLRLAASSPRFRATEKGAWFGGGTLIPWTEIKAVFESGSTMRLHGQTITAHAIAFEFHQRRTLFRTPIECWIAAPFALGDVDVATKDWRDTPSVLVARLEAMRVRANHPNRDEAGTND